MQKMGRFVISLAPVVEWRRSVKAVGESGGGESGRGGEASVGVWGVRRYGVRRCEKP